MTFFFLALSVLFTGESYGAARADFSTESRALDRAALGGILGAVIFVLLAVIVVIILVLYKRYKHNYIYVVCLRSLFFFFFGRGGDFLNTQIKYNFAINSSSVTSE